MDQSNCLSGYTIVFDLDGTLVDTAPDLIGALNHTLIASGFGPVPDMAVSDLIGSGAKAMIRAGLNHQKAGPGEQDIDRMFDVFLDHYLKNIAIKSKPYPGCERALSRLEDAGAILCVCTNKKQNLAEELLHRLGLSDRFASIVGADSVPQRKPDGRHILTTIERARGDQGIAVMIGDSLTDERAAHGAGLPFILCPFGYGPIGPEPIGHRTVLNSYDDLTADYIVQEFGNYAATASRDASDV
ncbi:MAG: HAD hydrolase-like protein [Pseudomonadota bacterium]